MDYDLGNKVKEICSEDSKNKDKKDRGFLGEVYDVAKGLAKKPATYAGALLLFGVACVGNHNFCGIRLSTDYVRDQYSGKMVPSKEPAIDWAAIGLPFAVGGVAAYNDCVGNDRRSSGPGWTEEGGDDIDPN